jgi:hypothetical protein
MYCRCGDNLGDGQSIQTHPSEVNMKTRKGWIAFAAAPARRTLSDSFP